MNANSDIVNAIILGILLIYLVYIFVTRKNKTPVGSIALWLIIFSLLILVYAYRFELNIVKDRFIAVLIPSYTWEDTKGQITIARSGNSHFYIDAIGVDNQKIHFLIDTGASDVAITQDDARKLGFDPLKLEYNRRYNTANGIAYAAPVIVKQMTIGKKTFYNFEAHVSSDGLDVSLLGMSLINNFSNFKITKDMLILEY